VATLQEQVDVVKHITATPVPSAWPADLPHIPHILHSCILTSLACFNLCTSASYTYCTATRHTPPGLKQAAMHSPTVQHAKVKPCCRQAGHKWHVGWPPFQKLSKGDCWP